MTGESGGGRGPRPELLAGGGFAIVLALVGMLLVVAAIDADAVPGNWVLYALPACGLLGFAGLAAMMTALAGRA